MTRVVAPSLSNNQLHLFAQTRDNMEETSSSPSDPAGNFLAMFFLRKCQCVETYPFCRKGLGANTFLDLKCFCKKFLNCQNTVSIFSI